MFTGLPCQPKRAPARHCGRHATGQNLIFFTITVARFRTGRAGSHANPTRAATRLMPYIVDP
jgi:hypothetical protein